MMRTAFSLAAALLFALSAFLGAREIAGLLLARRTDERLEKFMGKKEEKTAPGWLLSEADLRWLALEPGFSQARFWGEFILLAGLGAAGCILGLAMRNFLIAVAALLLVYYPFMRKRSRVKAVKERVLMGIPDLASVLAAFLVTLPSAEDAVMRAKDIPGVMGRLLSELILRAKQSGKPLFGQGGEAGGLLLEARRYAFEPLTAFFAQLEQIARAGTGGAEMMAALAESLQREHRVTLTERMEKLENDLVLPTTIFFFIPFVVGIIAPVLIGLFEQL